MVDSAPRVAVVDPSLFTLPYDAALCEGLAEVGATVSLWGRPLRDGEQPTPSRVEFRPVFFRRSEGLPRPIRAGAKGLAHLLGWASFVRALRAWKPDVIHLQWLPVPFLDGPRIAGLRRIAPVVLTVHDSVPFQGAASAAQRAGWFAAMRRVDRLLVHHDVTRQTLLDRGIDAGRVGRITHGVLAGSGESHPEPGLVLLFGAMKPYKGIDVALRALAATEPPLRLLVVGPPSTDPTPWLGLSRRLGIAERVDWDPRFVPEAELDAVLGRAWAFVLPYRHADASGVLWRIAGLGRPIVASRVGGLAEELEHEHTGLLVPPEQPDALAAALQRLQREPELAQALGRQLSDHAARHLSWADVARQTLAEYPLEARSAAAARRGGD